jgi:hypothetical protein
MCYIVGARNIALHGNLAILGVNDRSFDQYHPNYTYGSGVVQFSTTKREKELFFKHMKSLDGR